MKRIAWFLALVVAATPLLAQQPVIPQSAAGQYIQVTADVPQPDGSVILGGTIERVQQQVGDQYQLVDTSKRVRWVPVARAKAVTVDFAAQQLLDEKQAILELTGRLLSRKKAAEPNPSSRRSLRDATRQSPSEADAWWRDYQNQQQAEAQDRKLRQLQENQELLEKKLREQQRR